MLGYTEGIIPKDKSILCENFQGSHLIVPTFSI